MMMIVGCAALNTCH